MERSGYDERSGAAALSVNEDDNIRDHFRHVRDFDTKGVIHYLGLNAGVSMWRNPARVPSSGVKVTYCDGEGREDPENILEYFSPVNSYTRSGWCLDL